MVNHLGNSLSHQKYQGVKEFHMLAHIGCYCKIMVFSPLKLEVTYSHSSKVSNSNHQNAPKMYCKNGYNSSKYALNVKFPIITH